ncbi:hypothetical protein ACFO4O_16235 [Glaciecola siphonariae]|uniref:Secreted protein n=1 Tax=Glaciecola siphonariae TaxID=521012 RepID=A0ABV9LYP7_9ALTE
MNIKSTIVATTLIAASAFSAPAFSQENPVNQILSSMLKQAVSSASYEIDNQVEKNILSTGNLLSLDNDAPKGKVVITDIAKTKSNASENTPKKASGE